ncbi:MAG: haloacid dehalogenase-like hydrolase [Fimbriiglobus sp.]|jgi:phosphoglycolate phosphatase-like HAD superfamily hydrolase|nr:haloacid dehalogenase-like hydrolase [Fimbriiglobus sp.]
MLTLLFDIDGTLIRTHGAGKAAMETALRSAFGVADINDSVPYSGRTDRAIGRDLLAVHGVEVTEANVTRLTETYLVELPHQLAKLGGEVCRGVREVIAATHNRPDVLLGLLTGNVRRGAATKLSHFGLWDFFTVGGFGDHHFDRDDVARSAVQSAERHLGRPIDPNQVWVIGDTPLDISCARAVGAKAVAVATGWHSHAELLAHNADLLLHDLGDVAGLLSTWGIR